MKYPMNKGMLWKYINITAFVNRVAGKPPNSYTDGGGGGGNFNTSHNSLQIDTLWAEK